MLQRTVLPGVQDWKKRGYTGIEQSTSCGRNVSTEHQERSEDFPWDEWIAEPLTELTKNKPEQVEWNDKTELAFKKMKQTLVSPPLMRILLGLSFLKQMLQEWE